MKRVVWSALVLAFSLLVAAPAPAAAPAQAAAPAAPQGRKMRVAIFDFDYATVQTSTAALFGTNVDIGMSFDPSAFSGKRAES